MDRKTSWLELCSLKSKDSAEIWDTLEQEWFYRYGYPDNIHVDDEAGFVKGYMLKKAQEFGIGLSSCGSYYHRQNGHVERM